MDTCYLVPLGPIEINNKKYIGIKYIGRGLGVYLYYQNPEHNIKLIKVGIFTTSGVV